MSGTYRPPERQYTITSGIGKRNPVGDRFSFDVDGLMKWLRTVHPAETWFAGIHWKNNHRADDNFEGADLVALDFDWAPAHADGATEGMPPEEQAKVLEIVQCALTPARLAYSTPRGMRLLVLCDEPIPSSMVYWHYAAAAQKQAYETLLSAGCSPLLIVDAGNVQAARMMWVPNIFDGDFERSGTLIESEDGLTIENPAALMKHAVASAALELEYQREQEKQLEAQRVERAKFHANRVALAVSRNQPIPLSWEEAAREFDSRYASELDAWPARAERGHCPMCGSPDAFSVLNVERRLWACRSERHAGVNAGTRVKLGRVGGILDLVSYFWGLTPTEALIKAGLLRGGRR